MILSGAEDLRVIKTIESIKDAFSQLLVQKKMNEITVTELCQLARINKKTFYRYYHSLEELVGEMNQELTRDLLSRTKGLSLPEDLEEFSRIYLTFSAEQDQAFENFMRSGGLYPLRDRLVRDMTVEIWERSAQFRRLSRLEQDLLMAMTMGILLRAYQVWAADDKKQPIETVAETAWRLLKNGIEGFFQ